MDGRTEWASEGEPKQVGEPELALREQRRRMIVRKSGRDAPSRVAPQERFFRSCPSISQGQERFFVPS